MLLPAAALADFDVAGNDLKGDDNSTAEPGDPCGQCPDPADGEAGVAYRGPELWVQAGNVLFHLEECSVVETISISPPLSVAYGLGYDPIRDLFLVTDPGADVLTTVDMSGTRINTWPTPGPGPVGVAYDFARDLYWTSDWQVDALMAMNPDGSAGPVHFVPAGSRISGTGYDMTHDALVYHGRDQAMGYWINAETGGFIDSFMVPYGGLNNGSGAGVDPATNYVWITHSEEPYVFCIEGLGLPPTASAPSTWSLVKSLY
jgi:hypothetical protein